MSEPIKLDTFYPFGHSGRAMYAVRAPADMQEEALIGQIVVLDGVARRILGVSRQIGGPISVGEPIGIEVSPPTAGANRTDYRDGESPSGATIGDAANRHTGDGAAER